MQVPGIDQTAIQAMIAQLKTAASQARPASDAAAAAGQVPKTQAQVDFAQALKASLDSVSAAQNHADDLGQRFSLGDDKVNLSDVMIAMQKASISFQGTVQVRNKLVSAYQDMMGMQV